MKELPNKLVLGVMFIVIASMMVTTIAFFNMEHPEQEVYKSPGHDSNGEVAINVQDNEESFTGSSSTNAKVSINLKRDTYGKGN